VVEILYASQHHTIYLYPKVHTHTDTTSQAIHLHYQSASSRSPSSLLLTCLTNSTSCTSPNTTSLSASPALAPGSGFTLLAPATNTLRAYTINSASVLCEAAWDAKLRTWSAPSAITGNPKAHASSPIAAGLVGTDIWLFYFNEQKRLMSLTSAWKSGTWSIGTYPILRADPVAN
jgi:hypothetical protein